MTTIRSVGKSVGHNGAIALAMAAGMAVVVIIAQFTADGLVYIGEILLR